MSSSEDLYKVLECDSNATYEEIKRNYQRLIKEHHPDKHLTQESELFKKIDKAWKILRDTELRKEYDASAMENDVSSNGVVYDTIKLDELEFDENSCAHYFCRCGNSIVISRYQLSCTQNDITIECDYCSNGIVVNV